MARHLVHSFILTAALSPFVNAGPCRPSSSSAAVGTTTTEHSTLSGSALSTETIVTISETASSSSDDATSTAEDATSTEQSTVTGPAVSTDNVVTVSESVTSKSDDATSTEQSTLTGSTLSRDTTITASETATLSSEGTTKTEESTVTGSAASSTDVTTTISESAATTTATTCTPAEPPVYTETEDFMMTTMFEDAVTTTTAAEPPATTTEAYECEDNLKEPSPADVICGSRGYATGNSDGFRQLNYVFANSLLDCYGSCQRTQNCETFYYYDDGSCQLFKGTVDGTDDAETPFKTYETRCFCDTGIEPAPTCEDTNPIINGGWDDGKFSPWEYYPRASGRDIVDFKIKAGGQGDSAYRFQTGNFHFDKSMWIYQDVKACPGITFTCTFNWWWDKYYAIRQNDGSRLVPYVRIYQDDDDYALTSRYPTSDDDTMRWIQGGFRFTVPDSGETRIWYIASSPQGEWLNTSDDPCKPEWVHRPNALALDSMVCSRN
ncbi:Ff.00g014140.m01.CDS01 [Fusarium sp. VM40]|nr:hypothetical protein FAVG1_02524 [Fusarium avenaceum]CAJ0546787.1 Ff.00g014140.m01.CDS01 [Fusarium sp. VM40]